MDRQARKRRLRQVLGARVGRARAVPMGELHRLIFGDSPRHSINGTRGLRTLITELREEGVPVCASDEGYYLPRSATELLGQLQMEMEERHGEK